MFITPFRTKIFLQSQIKIWLLLLSCSSCKGTCPKTSLHPISSPWLGKLLSRFIRSGGVDAAVKTYLLIWLYINSPVSCKLRDCLMKLRAVESGRRWRAATDEPQLSRLRYPPRPLTPLLVLFPGCFGNRLRQSRGNGTGREEMNYVLLIITRSYRQNSSKRRLWSRVWTGLSLSLYRF